MESVIQIEETVTQKIDTHNSAVRSSGVDRPFVVRDSAGMATIVAYAEAVPGTDHTFMLPQSPHLQEVRNRIERFLHLQPGWNGYGAPAIDRELVGTAEALLHALPVKCLPGLRAVPLNDGRLQFEWHNGSRSLELEFETCTAIRYLKWDSGSSLEDESVINVTDVAAIGQLVEWFMG